MHRTLAILLLLLSTKALAQPSFIHIKGKAQGTSLRISYRPLSIPLPSGIFDSILYSVDRSLSLYDSNSIICAFNRSRVGVAADTHLLTNVQKALQWSISSQGAFDITIKPAMDAWGFGARPVSRIPTRQDLDSLRSIIGYWHLTIRNDSLLKDRPEIGIDCNGIAQGYTVDLLAECLIRHGIIDYLVELGGEIRLNGKNPEGLPWSVGIEKPVAGPIPVVEGTILPTTGAVTTSGDYRNTRRIAGRTIGHVMDPRTARPTIGRVVSATVTASDAMTADAVDNTCLVLGIEASMKWIAGLKGVSVHLLYYDKKGRLQAVTSSGFPPLH